MSSSNVSAVLFVKDLGGLCEFYRRTLDLSLTHRDGQHAVLSRPGFDLVVHRIPAQIAKDIAIEQPPRRRENAVIKLSFPVARIADVRALAAALGGELDPPDAEWSDGASITCKGHDPEGNVFQVCQVSL